MTLFPVTKDNLELRYKLDGSRDADVLRSRAKNLADGRLHRVSIRRRSASVSLQVKTPPHTGRGWKRGCLTGNTGAKHMESHQTSAFYGREIRFNGTIHPGHNADHLRPQGRNAHKEPPMKYEASRWDLNHPSCSPMVREAKLARPGAPRRSETRADLERVWNQDSAPELNNREDGSQIWVGQSFGDMELQLPGIYDGRNKVLNVEKSMFAFAGLDAELPVPPPPTPRGRRRLKMDACSLSCREYFSPSRWTRRPWKNST